MDPTTAALKAMAHVERPLEAAMQWAGISEAVANALRLSLGEFTLLRQIVHIPKNVWDTAIICTRVGLGEDARPLRPVEPSQ
eukprot:5098298-Alexandrium_andersonii.AAC.1